MHEAISKELEGQVYLPILIALMSEVLMSIQMA